MSEQQQTDNTTPETVAVNFASRKELQKLPGVGQAVAESVMQFRQTVGNLTVGDMLNIKHFKVSPEFNKMVTFKVNPHLKSPPKDDNPSPSQSDKSNEGEKGQSEDEKTQAMIDKVGGVIAQKQKMQQADGETKVEISDLPDIKAFTPQVMSPMQDQDIKNLFDASGIQYGYAGLDDPGLSNPGGPIVISKVNKGQPVKPSPLPWAQQV